MLGFSHLQGGYSLVSPDLGIEFTLLPG